MPLSADELAALSRDIKTWGAELGFQKVGVANVARQIHATDA